MLSPIFVASKKLNMSKILVKDKYFVPSITAAEIDKAVTKIADRMNKDLEGKDPLFIVVLNGAFMFASDIFKKLK